MTISLEGIEELNTIALTLNRAGGRVGEQGARVVRYHAFAVERQAKIFAPVLTGTLRASISVEFDGDGRFGGLSAVIGPEVFYGGYVEFGTSRQAPAAYMGPAFDMVVPSFVAAVAAMADPFEIGIPSQRVRG